MANVQKFSNPAQDRVEDQCDSLPEYLADKSTELMKSASIPASDQPFSMYRTK